MPVRGRPRRLVATNIEEKPPSEKTDLIYRDFCRISQWEQALDLDEWSDTYRVIPGGTSSEAGRWITKRFPFLRKIMKKLSPSSIAREIVAMKGSQLGFTEIAICWLLYIAHIRPGPAMYVQKTKEAAEDFSRQKLAPSIEACRAVHSTLGAGKPSRFANSWNNKGFSGGFIVLGGANSAPFLRSKSIRDAIADEEDSYNLDVDKEGSPVRLIAKRQVNFPDHKRFRPSTPVLAEMSTIEPAFEAGSQERYFVPCPFCNPEADLKGFMFWIEWHYIKWSEQLGASGYPDRVWLECPNCASEIDEAKYKTWMLERGEWFSTKGPGKDPVERYIVGDVENPSFHISSFYSPLGFFSWRDAVIEWFDYKRKNDITLLQVFINQTLGETFTLEGQEISYNYLQARREKYTEGKERFDIPAGGLVLTAGADIQDDRIEVEVVAWGLLEENWSIDYKVIPGDTSKLGDRNGLLADGRPSCWRLLDEYLMKRWNHESGVEMFIEVAMIDSNYKTEEAHTFCRLREHRRIFPIRGVEGWGKGYWTATRRRHERYGTHTYTAFVDELKNKIYAQLQIDAPGPGYCHFPKRAEYGEKYFKGLTCETRKVKYVKGRKKLYWETPSGARNEPIDCRGYSYVALLAYPVNLESRASLGLAKTFAPIGTSSGIARAPRRRRGSPGL